MKYLKRKGFQILEKNTTIKWQGKKRGEIDIIALKEGVYHFIEVKTQKHPGPEFWPELRANDRKLHKIARMALWWLLSQNKNLEKTRWQIDIIGITLDPLEIRHWEDVLEDPGL